MMIENTIYSGVGKPVYDSFVPYNENHIYDYKGRKVFKGEEYYVFDLNQFEVVLVHIEDVKEYLNDERLDVECYDLLIQLIELHYDNYPVIM